MKVIEIEVDNFTYEEECDTKCFCVDEVFRYNKTDYLILKILRCYPIHDLGIRVAMEVEEV